ncbi:hypothetical protein HDR63_04075 [bacterium]|nr:hypothetical protein [bacterium]
MDFNNKTDKDNFFKKLVHFHDDVKLFRSVAKDVFILKNQQGKTYDVSIVFKDEDVRNSCQKILETYGADGDRIEQKAQLTLVAQVPEDSLLLTFVQFMKNALLANQYDAACRQMKSLTQDVAELTQERKDIFDKIEEISNLSQVVSGGMGSRRVGSLKRHIHDLNVIKMSQLKVHSK